MNNYFVLFLVFLLVWTVKASYPGVTIDTTDGYIEGIEKDNHFEYLGIPYAQAGRFQKPEDPIKWNHILDTKEYGPICPQPTSHEYKFNMSEDCLTINVFVPKSRHSHTKYEVLFWIYGGGFRTGTGRVYDPTQFMNPTHAAPKIVVTFNYRVGAFGFLQTDENNANFGLYDQVKALDWVRLNIGKFMGDPNEITVFGESAGGVSTAIMFLSTRLHIKKAIIQSGIIKNYEPLPVEFKAKEFSTFLESIGCCDVACLQRKSMEDLIHVSRFGQMNWLPSIDPMIANGTISEMANQMMTSLGSQKKHLIIGSTHDEWNTLLCKQFPNQQVTEEKIYSYYVTQVKQITSEEFKSLMGIYHDRYPNKDLFYILSRILNDYLFHCPQTYLLDQFSRLPNQIFSRAYRLDRKFEKANECGGVTHAMDIPYLYPNTLPILVPGQTSFTTEEKKLSDTMINYWASFAGNESLLNDWTTSIPVYNYPVRLLNVPLTTEEDVYHSFCAKLKPYF